MTEQRGSSGSILDRKVSLKVFLGFAAALITLGMTAQQIFDVGDRQSKYIDRRNDQHVMILREVNKLRDEAVERRVWLAAKYGEVVP